MIQSVDVFVSKHDIDSGARWAAVLAEKLEESSFGILCLTADNLSAPWLLYEAGALTKHISGKVCGLLIAGLNPANISGPLAQFQHRSWERDNVRALVRDLNKGVATPLEADQIDLVFDKWWGDLESGYTKALGALKKGNSAVTRPDRELLEELLQLIRSSKASDAGQTDLSDLRAAVAMFFNRIVNALSSTQRGLLFAIAHAKSTQDKNAFELAVQSANKADVDELLCRGLMWRDTTGVIRITKLFAHHLRKIGAQMETAKA
jgi:hypothetical protein